MDKKEVVARAVRGLLREARKAVLSTVDPEGQPYASLHAVATAQDGSPLLLFSNLSQHTRNVRAEARAALLVERRSDATATNPQEIARACISGTVTPLQGGAAAVAADRYLRLHPEAGLYAGFGDFHFFQMEITKARFVGGFAQAASVSGALCVERELAAAFAAAESSILEHMNEDHADAVLGYAQLLGEPEPTTGSWRMAGLDADGFDLSLIGTNGEAGRSRVIRFHFGEPLSDIDQVRAVLVDLARKCKDEA